LPLDDPPFAWRLTRVPYADLTGRGGQLKSGRWHTHGRPVVYLSLEASLSVLEVLVNLDVALADLPPDYVLMRIDLTAMFDGETEHTVEDARYVSSDPDTARPFGDRWLAEGRTLLLRVASHVVPEASNLLLNPLHSSARNMPAPVSRPFAFDTRLLAPRSQ
jgi:RES domain-containing protein